MPEPVLTKADFVRRYIAGEFGNRPSTWGTIEEYLESNYGGLIHIRNRVTAGRTWYNVTAADSVQVWREAALIYGESRLYISTMGPECYKVFQGEARRDIWGLTLHYNTLAQPMREVPHEAWGDCTGLQALLLTQRYLDANSLEWLAYLLGAYEDHVVEFSTYDRQWGMVAGYNTVFWEVRKY